MIISIIFVVCGLIALVFGGECVVRGATGLCFRFGISKLVIGLVVVAFGTSVPELAVNLAASIQGRGGLCFGNVVGSNIANIGLILGITALVRPLVIDSIVINREIPMLLMGSAAAAALRLDRLLSGS